MSMFKNEAKNVLRLLESSYRYVDFFIFQNNGSEDGTQDIIESFFKEKNVPGFVYRIDEGWQGFGYNRNHLLQTTLNHKHGCDWILSIDCDEELKVDDNFDWSILDDTTVQSYNVTEEFNSHFLYRCRLYNARLPWKFNDDKAHETLYLDIPEIMYKYEVRPLPIGFRQIGYPQGESYSVKTKYLTDALLLEERLNREDTLLSDTYHFWYIGKSYHDAMFMEGFQLGKSQQLEYARRSNYYFQEYLNYTHNYSVTNRANRLDEMAYYAMYLIGQNYHFMDDKNNAIKYYNAAEEFCPSRNEHLVALAETYKILENYKKALKITTRLIDPNRKNPFPNFSFIINKNHYIDTGTYVKELHNSLINKVNKDNSIVDSNPILNMYTLAINTQKKKRLFVVDNFYVNPNEIRNYALGVEYSPDIRFYKGMRSTQQHIFQGTKEAFENIMGEKITRFEDHIMCGRFQICTAEDPIVFHYDDQKWAAMIYLSPDAPYDCGTSLLAHKATNIRGADDSNSDLAFTGGFYDKTKFSVVDTVGSVFNRLVIFDSRCIHAACQYFGNSKETGRLTHLFFFD